MSTQNRIIIIGGTACGPKAAARARRCDPSAEITIIEQGEDLSTATCGLPYYISGVIDNEDNMVAKQPDYFETTMNMEVLIETRATAINPRAHTVEVLELDTKKRSTISYDKLVIATGSRPLVPDWEGKDLGGIFTLSDIPDANAIRDYLAGSKDKKEVVIVGAGLIGLEMAEAFVTAGCKVTVLEALDRVLPALLDPDIAVLVEKYLGERGVKVVCGQRVTGFQGDESGSVRKVIAGDNEHQADLVLLSLGVRPDITLAKAAGLAIGPAGGISVNEYLQTSDPDIYAGGDCVENVNIITGKPVLAPMGSTANKHGRIIGTNVTGGSETFPGVLGTAIVKVFEYNVGRVGLNESQAAAAGYDTVMSLVPSNEHATYYPGSRDFVVKLVAEKGTGKLLGGQAAGPGDAAKRIDVMATALTFGATVADLANIDLAYAPPYNSALDPVHHAANVILNKQSGLARTITPAGVWKKLENDDRFVLLDVRTPPEWQERRIDAGQVRLLPLDELRGKLGELSVDEEIVIYCRTSIRAYQAQRIMDGAGFKNVKFMDGSLDAWPYAVLASAD
jgi:NADPH-dependent 2,4-dienoyl-CoA reductase/sulfur reductase-like enzyme/rhodanese-related sulfurtransferase